MPHPILLFVGIFCGLIFLSSIWNVISMIRVNLLFEQGAESQVPGTLVRTVRVKAGKNGLLPNWYGVYSIGLENGSGEFTSANPYGRKEDVPTETAIVCLPSGKGVLEHCDIWGQLFRKILPTWIAVGLFSWILILIAKLQA